ncbi:MAG: NeuD/PglB/VioB family sugar acetyltransferase [Sulfitobacter sp.]
MKTFGLYSAGGFAREVRASLVKTLSLQENEAFEIVYIDDDPSKVGTSIHGSQVVSYDWFQNLENKRLNVAFADPAIRKSKCTKAHEDGIEFFSLFAPTFIRGDNVRIGEGAIFANNTIVTADAVIGEHFHCNIYSYVAHDCQIGDYVTFAPRVSLNGRVVVQDNVYIGSDATILPGQSDTPLVIGAGAIIGAGAVVTKSVERGATVVGSPAKPLMR